MNASKETSVFTPSSGVAGRRLILAALLVSVAIVTTGALVARQGSGPEAARASAMAAVAPTTGPSPPGAPTTAAGTPESTPPPVPTPAADPPAGAAPGQGPAVGDPAAPGPGPTPDRPVAAPPADPPGPPATPPTTVVVVTTPTTAPVAPTTLATVSLAAGYQGRIWLRLATDAPGNHQVELRWGGWGRRFAVSGGTPVVYQFEKKDSGAGSYTLGADFPLTHETGTGTPDGSVDASERGWYPVT